MNIFEYAIATPNIEDMIPMPALKIVLEYNVTWWFYEIKPFVENDNSEEVEKLENKIKSLNKEIETLNKKLLRVKK